MRARLLSLCLVAAAVHSQTFDSVDVMLSQAGTYPVASGGILRAGRYELRHATILELIATAWGISTEQIIGGPDWLEKDRLDVIAKTSATTVPDAIPPMLKNLLTDRFHLKVHEDTKPLPAFILAAGKRPQLKRAAGSGESGCRLKQESMVLGGAVRNAVVVCNNVTMAEFAARVRGFAGYYVTHPVIDQSGLAGA